MSEADLVTPLQAAEMVTVVEAATALVLTVNAALIAPAATVTLDGTLAAVVAARERHHCSAGWSGSAQRHRAGR